jgi:predicted transposase/invertase (TIGR01784 family)
MQYQTVDKEYLQRMEFYATHLHSEQLRKAQKFPKAKNTTLIAVLNTSILPTNVKCVSSHSNLEGETRVSYIKGVKYILIELDKFHKKIEQLETVQDNWIFAMKNSYKLEEIPEGAPREVKEAYEVLEKFNWSEEECREYVKRKLVIMDYWNSVKTAEKRGVDKGIPIGEKRGILIGEKKGQHELLLKLIRYKFGDISAKDSSMIESLDTDQTLALSKAILEAQSFQELIQIGGCGNNMSRTSPIRTSPRKRLRQEISV